MNQVSLLLLALSTTLAACTLGDASTEDCTGGKCDGTGGGTCEDPRYNDGVCQTSIDCAAPDIDCFMTFTDDDAAAQWFAPYETQLAAEEGRGPRANVPASDPRFQRARMLLDRGWEAFKASRPVGLLKSARPSLVVLEDPTTNAFVMPDITSGKSTLNVVVLTGLLDTGASDDELLAVMMHEFQHSVGLHLIQTVKLDMRVFYVADEREPIGAEQSADPVAQAAGQAWMGLAKQVGSYNAIHLRGFPLGRGSDLGRIFQTLVDAGVANNAAGCARAVQLKTDLETTLRGNIDALGGELYVPSSIGSRATATLDAFRDECLASFPYTFQQVLASMMNATPEAVDAALSTEDRALVTGVHAVDAVARLIENRRARMRAIEEAFARESGHSWTSLRYFSHEEDADDVSVKVLRAAHLAPAALGDFFLGSLAAPACKTVLDAGDVPPYGVDLNDDHHAACWRVHHVRAYAAHTAGDGAARRVVKAAPVPTTFGTLLPRRVSDYVMH